MKRGNILLLYIIFLLVIVQKTSALTLTEGDSVAIPFSVLYQNSWGGEHTRLKTNIFDKSRDYILPLQLDSGNFVFPTVRKTHVCSPYGIRSGRMHTGMDIKQNLGDSIVAAWTGIVRMANRNYYGYGGTVVIRHTNGLETIYAHLSDIEVKENQVVKAGELIGFAGRTGRATTDHLHFETRFLYEYFDPRTIIDFNTFSLKADTLFIRKGKFSGSFFIHSEEEQLSDSTVITENLEGEKEVKKIEAPPPVQSPTEYIVTKGDTLYSIAKTNKISIDYLCRINNITQESILQIGQKLKLK
jgi:murein DD-endopeptidase MepM/ murein hydrolase activator NlpD